MGVAYFLKMVFIVNILKTTVTTYLGKQIGYGKRTEILFRLWYNILILILGYIDFVNAKK